MFFNHKIFTANQINFFYVKRLRNFILTATVDPFLPTPPVNIIDAFSNAKNADITTAKYRGNVFTSIFPNGS